MARRKHAERAAAEAMKARRAYYQHVRSNRQRRQMLYAFGPILAVVLGLVGYAYYTFQYAGPREPVARVQGQAISAAVFSQRLQYSRRQVLNNVRQLMSMISTDQSSFITQYATSQRTGVVQSTLDTLVDEVLIQKEAEARKIAVTDQEVHDEICRQLQEATKITSPSSQTATAAASGEGEGAAASTPDAVAATGAVTATEGMTGTGLAAATGALTATDGITATGGVSATDPMTYGEGISATGMTTDTGAAALPTDVPKPACELSEAEFDRSFEQLYDPVLTEAGMTRATYDNLVRMNVYREKLNKILGAEVATTAEQVEVQYLVFSDSGAAAGAEALAGAKGGTAWDDLVARYGPRAADDETAGGPTTDLTETATGDGASVTYQNEDPAAATGAVTATGATTGTAAAAPTVAPAPTAVPDRYAVAKSDAPAWHTKESLKTELGLIDADVDKVFALAAGKPLDALVKGSQGNYLILVTAKDAKRPLPETDLKTKREGALEEWLKKTRTEKSAEISKFPLEGHTPPEPQWYIDGFDKILGNVATQPTLDVGALITTQPAGTPVP